MQRRAAYGFDLDPDLDRLLRSRPPAHVLEWVREAVGAHRVTGVRALSGGMSSAVHLVKLKHRAGLPEQVVLRRYVRDWLREKPDAPANEAAVLARLTKTPVPAPRLIAADPDGSSTGVPSVVMTALPGRVVWEPTSVDGWLRRIAEALPEIHQVPVAEGESGLRCFAPYAPEKGLVPPPWTKHRGAWLTAIELYEGVAPDVSRAFVHRDYHPGNILWSRNRISGIVDWVGGCVGPPETDVAHCRYNLAVHAGRPDAADRFLEVWQSVTGRRDYHPYWDLTTIVSVVTAEPDPALDEFAARASARMHA